EEGYRYKKCLICGEIWAEETIPKKETMQKSGCKGAINGSFAGLLTVIAFGAAIVLRKRKIK
ncbi:MAG: hypothetical protein J6Z36_04950, partial [Clostridia bacterium]|nr:hypothetical protein [Clostridia bacterium]